MSRYFIDAAHIVDSHIEITGEDAGHILQVLRYEPGDSIILCDGAGLDYPAVIIETGKDRLIARLGMVTRQRVNRILKWFYIKAYPKAPKWI